MPHVDQDVTTKDFAAFAAANDVDFHDGDRLKLHVWVGNHSEMERLAEIFWTGADAEAIVNYDTDEATDHERDTFLLEAVIEGLQRELDRRARNNYDALPEHIKEALDASVDDHPGLRRSRPEPRQGVCCEASRDGGEHDHGTLTVDLA